MQSCTTPEFFHENGYASPYPVLDEQEVVRVLAAFAELETRSHGRIKPLWNIKIHLLVPWIWNLVHDRRIIEPVKAVLGEDLLCWGVGFFAKSPNDRQFVSMHQDAYYWNLTEPKGLTAWLALTPSVPENGCLEVIPGSHRSLLPHTNSPTPSNMLPAGEHVAADGEVGSAAPLVLNPGEMSLHHCQIIHGSKPAAGEDRRIGLTIRYIDGSVAQTGEQRGSATLISGRDHGTFDLESAPRGLLNPADIRAYTDLSRRFFKVAF
ncbi:phytanoyl-CoA dioxygenase family protein [Kordiimonas aestuarii]|uniref:phytanoyl-CoA dioxygenase family protein n=1 Tax=Kordiimonas aestuarii TaxID=1005925 RepID=UPI0021CE370E|nr:phytanoyl-CoA dioxygenase family protein [Kordiimonas aestuarii]